MVTVTSLIIGAVVSLGAGGISAGAGVGVGRRTPPLITGGGATTAAGGGGATTAQTQAGGRAAMAKTQK